MTQVTIDERCRRAFASQGYSVAGANALPEDWQAKFGELCPANGDWYDRTDPENPVHLVPDLPVKFNALWREYLVSQKATAEPAAMTPAAPIGFSTRARPAPNETVIG